MEKTNKKILLFVLAAVVLGMIWYWGQGHSERQQKETVGLFEDTATMQPEAAENARIYVHIVGAVKKPGVYSFDSPPRVVEVVEQAGGFTKDAIKAGINQAETVEDGSQIVIESKKDAKKQEAASQRQEDVQQSSQRKPGLININKATKEELMTLPGIGESKAGSIISYRDTNGVFKKIEDIMNITGIKTGVFDKIKDQIEV